jgi:hypothetical protein
VLYRSFPMVAGSRPGDDGGPLFVPRLVQGGGRHDNPAHYGALYLSRTPESPVAEILKDLRRREVADRDFGAGDIRFALAPIDDSGITDLLDLDDPESLIARGLRPSQVATGNRRMTRRMALSLYREGANGFEWWSTIEASWVNVTLFADRTLGALRLAGDPEALSVDHPAVRTAAEAVGVELAG